MNFATTVDPEDALKVYKYSDVRAFWDEISPLQALLTHGKQTARGFLYAQEAQAT